MKHLLGFLLAVACVMVAVSASQAATWVAFSATAGAQCTPSDINNSGVTVGNCAPPSSSANNVAWVGDGAGHGAQTPLAPLASGQPCSVWGIAHSGQAIGGCADANNAYFATVWNSALPSNTPLKLDSLPATLLFPLLRPKDVSTAGTAVNGQGDIAGVSLNATGAGTVVFYAAGSGAPERVSGWGDGCLAVDINLPSAGNPYIAMNCPNAAGNSTATVAIKGALGYGMTALALPTGASYCSVIRATNASQFVGTCVYPNSASNVSKTAYWSSATAAPLVLTLSDGSRNSAIGINQAGLVLAKQTTADGRWQNLAWRPSTSPFPIVQFIPMPSGSVWAQAIAIVDGSQVAVNAMTASQYFIGCTWSPSAGNVCVPAIAGGSISQIAAISENGAYMAGMVLDATQTSVSVTTALP
jgi:hypothetical protein